METIGRAKIRVFCLSPWQLLLLLPLLCCCCYTAKTATATVATSSSSSSSMLLKIGNYPPGFWRSPKAFQLSFGSQLYPL